MKPRKAPDWDPAKPSSHVAMCAAMLHTATGWDDPRYRLLCAHSNCDRQ
ncbi:MAG: hypothetical protein L7W95_04095 [Alphaproteobacteria bacterium]|nr:hypothetical protein [Alphaproteobacteria bacterium]